jgi:uncharacterized protein (DUF2164 family)
MAITLSADTTTRLRASIKKFLSEQLNEDAGDLKATLFLDFCLQEIAPSVYNRAIADAQVYFTGRVQDFCWSLEHLRCSRGSPSRHRSRAPERP